MLGPVDLDLRRTTLGEGVVLEVDLRGGHRVKERGHHVLIDGIGGESLPDRGLGLGPQIVTQILITALVLPCHLVTTPPTVDQPLEQRRALAGHAPPPVVLLDGIVVIQEGLHARQGLPRHVGRVTVVHDHLPLR